MPRKKLAERLMFKVVYEPDDGGWHAHIPSVRGCRTWGRSLAEARRNIREALATCADVFDDPDEAARRAELIDDVRLSAETRKEMRVFIAHQRRAEREAARAEDAARRAARALTKSMSLRDAGELLGVSYERVRRLAG